MGSQRHVFVHPADSRLIVKVPHDAYVARRSGVRSWKWYKKHWRRRLRVRHFIVFQREINEHLAVRATGPLPPHMQTILGFLETDLGMGLVCACVRTRDGALAPTLKEIIDAGTFDENARIHLEEFFAWLRESPIVVGDLNIGNIVYGHHPSKGDLFVLVDGIGDKNLIPFSSFSRRLNRSAKRRRIARLREEIDRAQKAATDAPANPKSHPATAS